MVINLTLSQNLTACRLYLSLTKFHDFISQNKSLCWLWDCWNIGEDVVLPIWLLVNWIHNKLILFKLFFCQQPSWKWNQRCIKWLGITSIQSTTCNMVQVNIASKIVKHDYGAQWLFLILFSPIFFSFHIYFGHLP